jgi:hypothetical protein
MMRSSENDPQIAATARRLRDFLVRQPGYRASTFAGDAGVPERELTAVLAPERGLVDPGILIDVIVEVIRRYGVDTSWILTGEYNPATHRALDEQGPLSQFEVRRLVAERLPSWSPSRPVVRFPA